jgi:hypothetical protein
MSTPRTAKEWREHFSHPPKWWASDASSRFVTDEDLNALLAYCERLEKMLMDVGIDPRPRPKGGRTVTITQEFGNTLPLEQPNPAWGAPKDPRHPANPAWNPPSKRSP